MNKYLIKEGLRGMYFLGEGDEMNVADYVPTRINYMYTAEKDGKLTYIRRDGSKTEMDVEAGDLVLEFYSGYDFPRQCIVVKSELWKNNIEAQKEAALKRAEKTKNLGDVPNCADCITCESTGV